MGRIVSVVMGVVVGAVFSGVGLWLGGDHTATVSGMIDDTTTTTVVTVAPTELEPPWTEEGGVRFESTVVVVDDFFVEDSSAVLDYRLIALGGGERVFFGGAQLPVVLPEEWELVTQTGEVLHVVSDPPRNTEFADGAGVGVRDSVRFETEDGSEMPEVAAVRVVGWRVAVPVDQVAELAGVSGSSTRLLDGTVISIQTILEQRTGALIDLDLERPTDPWRVGIDQGFGASTEFVGDGPGWKRASSTIGGVGLTGGITGFQLVWSETTPPDVVRVRASLVSWESLSGDVTVWRAV